MTKPLHHFDKRILPRSIRKGLVSDEEFQTSLGALSDSSDNIAPPEPEEGSPEAQAASEGREAEAAQPSPGEAAASPSEPPPDADRGPGSPPVDPASGGA